MDTMVKWLIVAAVFAAAYVVYRLIERRVKQRQKPIVPRALGPNEITADRLINIFKSKKAKNGKTTGS